MPVVFRLDVAGPKADAKFWLVPKVELANNRGYDARTIRRLQDMVADHRDKIVESWNEHFR